MKCAWHYRWKLNGNLKGLSTVQRSVCVLRLALNLNNKVRIHIPDVISIFPVVTHLKCVCIGEMSSIFMSHFYLLNFDFRAVLESHHAAMAFKLTAKDSKSNILKNLER